eukprot:g3505.t1
MQRGRAPTTDSLRSGPLNSGPRILASAVAGDETFAAYAAEKRRRRERDFEGVSSCSRCVGEWFTPNRAVCCLTIVCALNYLDRGIVSGAAQEITGCVPSFDKCTLRPDQTEAQLHNCTLECKACGPCGVKQTGFGINMAQLGFLQSSFMVGYSLSSIVYSQLVHRIRPFKLISVALVFWIVAVVLSGLSGFWCDAGVDSGASNAGLCGSFYLAIFARALSGVGEAATATIAAVYLDDAVPPEKKGLMFGIYYSAIPLGTALGFVYAGQIANAFRWEWAFLGEAPPMVLFAVGAWFIPFRLRASDSDDGLGSQGELGSAQRRSTVDSLTAGLLNGAADVSTSADYVGNDNAPDKIDEQPFLLDPQVKPTLWSELYVCFTSPVYMMTAFGYAAYTAVIAGFSYYGPTYIRKQKAWNIGETEADTVFGGIVAATGLVGTALGGIVLDRCSGKAEGAERLVPALGTVLCEVVIGTAICVLAGFCTTPNSFFVALAFGVLFMFMTTAGVNVALMWSVPPANRTTAMALSVIIIHLIGDVPSPIVIGEIDRTSTPKMTFLLTSSWLFWAIFCWCAALVLARLKVKRNKALSEEELLARSSVPAMRGAASPYQRYGFSEEDEETEDEISPRQSTVVEQPVDLGAGHEAAGWSADRL